jgi:uncharacterized membrane protein
VSALPSNLRADIEYKELDMTKIEIQVAARLHTINEMACSLSSQKITTKEAFKIIENEYREYEDGSIK